MWFIGELNSFLSCFSRKTEMKTVKLKMKLVILHDPPGAAGLLLLTIFQKG